MTEEQKMKIKDILEKQNPYLYLGAGFSKGAMNKYGKEIPLGNELSDIVLKKIETLDYELAEEISNKNLREICQELKDLDEKKYLDTIISSLSGFNPMKFQEYISDYSWNSIFTVNIDDLVEQCYESKNYPIQVFVGKNHRERIKEKEQKLYKLHGSVRKPEEGIVFSTSEYSDFISDVQDFNLKSLIIAFESNDFFVVGTELNELEIDYFLSIYKKRNTDLIKFNVIFINPKPSKSLKNKIAKNDNFCLIETTSADFFSYIHEIKNELNKSYYNFKSLIKRSGFKNYEQIKDEYYDREAVLDYETDLYFGSEPKWEDLLYNFIIDYSDIKSFITSINNNKRINVLYGPLYSGKTTTLKYLFYYLSNNKKDILCLYNMDSCINIENIRLISKKSPESIKKIYLLFDDIGEYYSLFNDVLQIDNRIVIIGTASLTVHNRKRYSLQLDNEVNEYLIAENLENTDVEIIRKKYIEKGLAGDLVNKDLTVWFKKIKNQESIVSAMYSLTNSQKFKSYYDNYFLENNIKNDENYNLLLICSFTYLLDIPYIKQYMLSKLGIPFKRECLEMLKDFIKIKEDGSIRIRTKYIAVSVINLQEDREIIVKLITKICISISSLIRNSGRDYNKNVYEYLTKYKYLRTVLGLSNTQIQKIYKNLKPYYESISYYWLQLGISEQHSNNYNYALQHFKTALAINPNSYGVQHAIARNYCKQAVALESIVQAKETFNIGKHLFIDLIKLKEYTRSKSYSIHSLVYELMEFHEKYNLPISSESKKLCLQLLNDAAKKDVNDYMMTKLQGRFLKFINKNFSLSDDEYSEYEETLDY